MSSSSKIANKPADLLKLLENGNKPKAQTVDLTSEAPIPQEEVEQLRQDPIDFTPWDNLKYGGPKNAIQQDIDALFPKQDISLNDLVKGIPEVPEFMDLDASAKAENSLATLQRYYAIKETLEKMKVDAYDALKRGFMTAQERQIHYQLIDVVEKRLIDAKNHVDLARYYYRNYKKEMEVQAEERKTEGAGN
ncbi:MAG: hypothetical protein ABIE74_00530 [Pseudomonadota bacterium]